MLSGENRSTNENESETKQKCGPEVDDGVGCHAHGEGERSEKYDDSVDDDEGTLGHAETRPSREPVVP